MRSVRDVLKKKKCKFVSTEEALKNVEPFFDEETIKKLTHKETLLKGKEDLMKR
jgi:hypothetical protein